ncbi:phosphotransferase [Nocardioides sp. cx-169]|uniref:phosphotransferase family protein n=1 Tax=Nocardioides sp. cx-169 TaxID=2899080 RepID=UPI001E4FA088|nr:phosphotransferase [Nocardioides sp. cx-169]MCD4534834.1 phosphotransferase [Nocardioides sp. cx-169]
MDFASLTPVPGGWSGETFLAEAAGERQIVRVYARPRPGREHAHEVDASLLRLVGGLLPVADALEARRADPASGMPALLVTSVLPGERGDLVLPRLDEEGLARIGRAVGEVVATLGGIAMLRPGAFVDGDLTLGGLGAPDGLPEWVAAHEDALAHWPQRELQGLREVALDAQALLDTVARTCLVHGDLNPKNLLVDPGSLAVTGVVDWEYAHAGHPFTDLGNVLRFDREPAYVEAVLGAYTERFRAPPHAALELARAADLWALIELAGRREENPVAARAERLLRAVARGGDLHAGAGKLRE